MAQTISEDLAERGIHHFPTKNHTNTGKHELWRGKEKLGEFTAWEACQFIAEPEKAREAWRGIINDPR